MLITILCSSLMNMEKLKKNIKLEDSFDLNKFLLGIKQLFVYQVFFYYQNPGQTTINWRPPILSKLTPKITKVRVI